MKNLLIILVLVAGLGFAGYVATAKIVGRHQLAQEREAEPSDPAERDLYLLHRGTRATANFEKRVEYAFIGGGAAGVLGLGLGIGIVTYLDRRRKRLFGV